MNKTPKLISSKSFKLAEWNNSALANDDAFVEIAKLKEQGGKNMYVYGGANTSETFVNDNLFVEYRIGVAPISSGNSRPLFRKGVYSKNATLVPTQQLLMGGVIFKIYKVSFYTRLRGYVM